MHSHYPTEHVALHKFLMSLLYINGVECEDSKVLQYRRETFPASFVFLDAKSNIYILSCIDGGTHGDYNVLYLLTPLLEWKKIGTNVHNMSYCSPLLLIKHPMMNQSILNYIKDAYIKLIEEPYDKRKMLSDDEFKTFDKSVTLTLKTRCPNKWIIVDAETGGVFQGSSAMNAPRHFEFINKVSEKTIDKLLRGDEDD